MFSCLVDHKNNKIKNQSKQKFVKNVLSHAYSDTSPSTNVTHQLYILDKSLFSWETRSVIEDRHSNCALLIKIVVLVLLLYSFLSAITNYKQFGLGQV